LSLPKLCSLNLHNGDIDKYRGHFSTFWEIINKEDYLCVTLHNMTKIVDSGCIYDQEFADKDLFLDFWDVMVWKKIVGGTLLAKNLNILEEKNNLDVKKVLNNSKSKYYSFPVLKDLQFFRF